MKKVISLLVGMMFLLVSFASAHMDDMMYGMYGGFGWGMMLFSWAFFLLILVALVLLIVWLIKHIQKK